MRLKAGILLVVVVIMALIVGQAVLAQQTTQSTQDTIELIGAIQTINADGSIVVNGVTVTITTAQLNVALTAGQVVKIEGTLLPDGRIAAREVQAPTAGEVQNNDEIELVGVVESFNGTTLVVNGLVIDLNGAEINDPIVVGQIIRVHGTFDANGNLIARETDNTTDDDDNGVPSPASTPEVGDDNGDDNDDNRPGEFEITGTLQQVGDGFIVVNGQTISIAGAEVKNQLVVGALVKVHVSNQNGQLVAREVENARDDDDDNNNNDDDNGNRPGEFEITGTLQQVGDGFIVVNGQTISITGAEIKNQLVVGALVKIHLSNQNGQLVAREVENTRDDDDDRNGDDDNSGPGSNNSGPGGGDRDDDDGGNSGSGNSGNSGSGGGDDDDGGNSASGSGGDRDDDDGGSSGRGGGNDSDDD